MAKYSLVGIDGNAFAVMGYVKKAMETEGRTKEQIEQYTGEAQQSDYRNLLVVSQTVVDVLNKDAEAQMEFDFEEEVDNG